jgi:hypothetical protein
MVKPLGDRRSGSDRRARTSGQARQVEHRALDRRQFPPPQDPLAITEAARKLLAAIDAHKKERGLLRLTSTELLAVLESMGYRQA